MTMKKEIERQINLLTAEQVRVKKFLNDNLFDCTTAPFVLAVEYRAKLKTHISTLRMNLIDLDD